MATKNTHTPQPSVDPNLVEATAQEIWDRFAYWGNHLKEPPAPWGILPDLKRAAFRRAIDEVLEDVLAEQKK